MSLSRDTRPDRFTARCRELIRSLSYEDILAWTVYVPPLLLMVGPATIVGGKPLINCALNATLGCAGAGLVHRMGRRLLAGLPNDPKAVSVSRAIRLPVSLSLTQLLWILEAIVAAAAFTGIIAKRLIWTGGGSEFLLGLACALAALGLYFVPVLLGKEWIRRYYPTMPLLSPTDQVINTSLPGLRSIF